MNILDENVREDQRRLLRSGRTLIRQIGYDIGRKGMKDKEIIPFLHQQRQPTFFTRDQHFYDPKLCHVRYCLVYLAVERDEVALFVRRVLHHSELDSKARRMGTVMRVSSAGISLWRLNADQDIHIDW